MKQPGGAGAIPRPLLIAALSLLALEMAGLVVQQDRSRQLFVGITLLQGLAYAAVVFQLLRRPAAPAAGLLFVLGVAALLRIGPLLGPVVWSSDIYRYVWDGMVQGAGFNPYCCIPEDRVLAHLRDEDAFPGINRRGFAPTIYPPVAQMAFALQAWLGGKVLAMKILLVGFEAIGIAAMVLLLKRQGRRLQDIALYAWHPLPIWEIAGSGHVDALIVAFVPLALLAALSGRRILTGVALGAAVLTKFIPLVLVPALWRRGDWRMPLALLAFIVACYLPYLGVGMRVFGYLKDYPAEEGLLPDSGSGFWVVDTLRLMFAVPVPAGAYLVACMVVLALLALRYLGRADRPQSVLHGAMVLGFATVMLLSPHYAWYFVWVIMLLTLSPWLSGLWPTLTAFLLYWDPEGGRVPTWVGGVIYGGFLILAIAERVWSHLQSRRTRSLSATREIHGARRPDQAQGH